MGCSGSKGKKKKGVAPVPVYVKGPSEFETAKPIPDRFTDFKDLSEELRRRGLEASQLIVAIDFTKSNQWNGEKTFGGKSLHDVPSNPLASGTHNPYERAIAAISRTLRPFDDDGFIPGYGFGEGRTKGHSCFDLQTNDVVTADTPISKGFDGLPRLLEAYRSIVPTLQLSGPTDYSAVIHRAVEHVVAADEYHILLILSDGEVVRMRQTMEALRRASGYALSIIVIGVGDGPVDERGEIWGCLKDLDDEVGARRFDNLQAFAFNEVVEANKGKEDLAVALHACMELPDQYQLIKRMGLL